MIRRPARLWGVSRDTFYRVKEAKDTGGLEALVNKDRRRANLKNRVDEVVEEAVLAFCIGESGCRAGSQNQVPGG